MNLQDMIIAELQVYRKNVQHDELFPALDAEDQEKIATAHQHLAEVDAVLRPKMEERFWEHQQRDTSKGL